MVDKPAFLSSIPRGRHVRQSVVVRLRDELGLPELSPLHRLDRITSGLLLLATERRWRGAYQRCSRKVRSARHTGPWRRCGRISSCPSSSATTSRSAAARGSPRSSPDAPVNAETLIELESRLGDVGVYRLTPRTGRTHQLRLHLNGLGIPIVDDPLYPTVHDIAVDDFSRPLQLLAAELELTDPFDGTTRRFESVRSLPL